MDITIRRTLMLVAGMAGSFICAVMLLSPVRHPLILGLWSVGLVLLALGMCPVGTRRPGESARGISPPAALGLGHLVRRYRALRSSEAEGANRPRSR